MILSTTIRLAVPLLLVSSGMAGVSSTLEFAPHDGMVAPPERPHRDESCLNGTWQFQPVPLPQGYARNQGAPPPLPAPRAAGWAATPVKIPSAWNVNTWGGGRPETRGADRLYWPDSIYYPSYPVEWDRIEMGWLKRNCPVPDSWRGRRVLLHFEAVAGECRVLFNGREVARHFDNFLPFQVDVTDHVRWGGDNELLVGIRGQNLFNQTSPKYPKFHVTYPPGSMTDSIVGIWQDVYLLSVPVVRVADTFVQPQVSAGRLVAEVELVNDTAAVQKLQVSGEVHPWRNEAGRAMIEVPVPRWRLDPAVLAVPAVSVTLQPGEKARVVLQRPVARELKLWTPGHPHLYGLVVTVRSDEQVIDRQYTRFGWRELEIRGADLVLNGEKVKLMGDFVHPFGAYMMSRRFVWAWYQMIKDVGANAVRPHAQIHPRMYLDLADEMGLLLLAETSIFGSSIRLNPDVPAFWERYAAHYDGMVRRDRNHPSVMGWSFGNEMFAIPRLNQMTPEDTAAYYAKLIEMAKRSLVLDPTRTWITCDGDEDLQGTLPVWSKHYGHGDAVSKLPKGLKKPLTVGESGGTYYATPVQLSEFNGDRAYEDYLGRNEALAIDLYDNVVNLALPHLAYFSPSLLAWYGLEHLNLGYRDFSRLPTLKDGVHFTREFAEGKPGMQPERLPPYTTTFNPGYDPELPLYKPLPMFDAMKAALAPGGPKPSPWDHRPKTHAAKPATATPTIREVTLAGPSDSTLRARLRAWGVPVVSGDATGPDKLLIIDAQGMDDAAAQALQPRIARTLSSGASVWVMVRDAKASEQTLRSLAGERVQVTPRWATMLQPDRKHPWAAGLGMKDLYFAGLTGDRRIQKCGLAGPAVERGEVVLAAGKTDWSLFNQVPEKAKAGAALLYEHLEKPAGAALVRVPHGRGTLVLSSLDYQFDNPAATELWRRVFANLGVALRLPGGGSEAEGAKKQEHDLLLNGPIN